MRTAARKFIFSPLSHFTRIQQRMSSTLSSSPSSSSLSSISSSSHSHPAGCCFTIGSPAVRASKEPEGKTLPSELASFPFIIDAHVHVFPDRLFDAIWKWFDEYGWEIRYQLYAENVVKFLLDKGLHHVVVFNYSHKPGMSRALNKFSTEIMKKFSFGKVIALGTVLPGEDHMQDIVEDAFKMGLYGLKLHSHVQLMAADEWDKLDIIYQTCVKHNKPIIFHAGQEPSSRGYKCNTYEICNAEKIEKVLQRYPSLKLCVPHLGAAEYDKYFELVEKYPNFYLDTTMAVGYWFDGTTMNPPIEKLKTLLKNSPDSIMYGSDFPNIPYAWDREIKKLVEIADTKSLEWIFGKTAAKFYDIPVGTSKL